jgi:SH3-like domain-containing protein
VESKRIVVKATLTAMGEKRGGLCTLAGVVRMTVGVRHGALFLACLLAAPAAWAVMGPSGKPVPRFESLKYNEINGRQGPSLEHRVLWTFHRRGLPVRVIAESDVWRQVEDPDGEVSWVQATGLAAQQTVFVSAPGQIALRRAPDESASTAAILMHGVVASLEECRGGWRKLRVGAKQGWARMVDLWAADKCQPREKD